MAEDTDNVTSISSAVPHARTISRSSSVTRGEKTRQLEEKKEVSGGIIGTSNIIAPEIPLETLAMNFSRSNILQQCVECKVTNITGFGYGVVAISKDVEIDEAERELLQSFVDYANPDESLGTIMGKETFDYERLGFGLLEVIRDASGNIAYLRQLPVINCRKLVRSGKAVTIERKLKRGGREIAVKEGKRFSRWVQTIGKKTVYFKEFGDPRKMDYTTGEFSKRGQQVKQGKEATEVIHFRQYSDDEYGIPRWLPQIPSILGSREAEEVNLQYFRDNMIPAAILSIAGGRLTQASFDDLKKLIQSESIGKDRQNKLMLLEAIPQSEGLDDKGTVSIQLDKLSSERPSDGLFSTYDKDNQTKVRSAFRLPPGLLGQSQDVTFATANVATAIAETQVFSVDRKYNDEVLNRMVVNGDFGLGLKTVKLESHVPDITNPDQIVKTLTALNVMGAVTPRKAVELANHDLQMKIPQYPAKGEDGYEEWTDKPVTLTLGLQKNDGTGQKDDNDQNSKTKGNKDTEGTGDTNFSNPENGQE